MVDSVNGRGRLEFRVLSAVADDPSHARAFISTESKIQAKLLIACVQLIQALLQTANPGAAQQALLGLPDADVQERARMHQLQALLAALQVGDGALMNHPCP